MITLLSPAKSLDYESPVKIRRHSEPHFKQEAGQLSERLGQMSPEDLSDLMRISSKLAELNFHRFANLRDGGSEEQSRQALFAFKGDVYLGLKAQEFSAADVSFAQNHLRILSGLYGILRPLDRIMPYRLEMGTSLSNPQGENLYAFWGNKLTEHLNRELDSQRSKAIINLASNEYFSSLQAGQLQADVVQPVFKDLSKGQYRVLSFFAKTARGEMAAWLIRNRIDSPDAIPDYTIGGYRYCESESSERRPVFKRDRRD